ncbi:MAG: hypothetical protein HYY40_13045 [Bacteroidetes bacterium]|nr:hypothetical protein [Bacteroidota bacterium]
MADSLKNLLILPLCSMLFSCSVKIEESFLNEMILKPEKGIIAGVDIGDSWETIKINHNPEWEIREENIDGNTIYQLWKRWDEHDNTMHLTFNLDGNKIIREIEFRVRGTGENAVTIRKFMHTIYDHYSKKLNIASSDSWQYATVDGARYKVRCTRSDFKGDEVNETVKVEISPE